MTFPQPKKALPYQTIHKYSTISKTHKNDMMPFYNRFDTTLIIYLLPRIFIIRKAKTNDSIPSYDFKDFS